MTIRKNIPLGNLTTFKVGGPARYFCEVRTVLELKQALAFARAKILPHFILAGGSNLLVSDNGFDGLVIKVEIGGITYKKFAGGAEVSVGAGEVWDEFVFKTINLGLGGLENLSGIPGTVGATPIQNVGAYGAEVKNCVSFVEAINVINDETQIFSNQDCQFSYRNSFFKTTEGKQYVITKVAYKLRSDTPVDISYKDLALFFADRAQGSLPSRKEVREAVLSIRGQKFPDITKIGTAGSFFKNPIISEAHFKKLKAKWPGLPVFPVPSNLPATSYQLPAVKVPLAFILDKVCNLKGVKHGKAALHDAQPLVFVNVGGATSEEVRALAHKVTQRVKDETGIDLEWEVQLV